MEELAAQGGATAIGIGLQQFGHNQQMHDTYDLMNMQQQNQMALNSQMQGIQQQNWDYTNYENQVKHAEAAGLNVGMLYGGGGSGGQSMGGGSGGSAASGQAPQNNMAMALQNSAIQSQIELNKANANKANAEATSTSGVQTQNATADTNLKNKQIEEIATKMGVNTETAKKIVQEIEQSKSEVKVNEATIPKIGAETKNITAETNRTTQITPYQVIEEKLTNELTKTLTSKTKQEIENYKQDLINSIKNTIVNQRNASTNEKGVLNQQTRDMWQNQLSHMGMSNEQSNKFIDQIIGIMGITSQAGKSGGGIIINK